MPEEKGTFGVRIVTRKTGCAVPQTHIQCPNVSKSSSFPLTTVMLAPAFEGHRPTRYKDRESNQTANIIIISRLWIIIIKAVLMQSREP